MSFPFGGRSLLATFVLAAIACLTAGRSQPKRHPSTMTLLIECNPSNLDPRFATDTQSQRIDALTDRIRVEMNQDKRKALRSEVPKTLAEDLPYLPLWFNNAVSVHRR